MKHYQLLLVAVFIWCICPQVTFGSRVNTTGKWGDNIIRTIFPKAPEVSVEGNVLSVYCADALADLTVVVVDSEGKVVMEESVTVSSGETKDITLDATAGTYKVILKHTYGNLQGEFVLN